MKKKAKKSTKKTSLKEKTVVPMLKTGLESIKKIKIRVIGVGGGAGTIVSEIAAGMPKASFVAANTDIKALRGISKKVSAFQFGQSLTHGLGTGMSADLGKEAALADKERITKLLEGQDLCIIIACLGGGSGSGAAPVFAKISQSLGNLTYGIFTLPLKFEGEKKMETAKEALRRVKNYLNVLTLIPNEGIFQMIDKNTPLKEALSAINEQLAESLKGLIETIYEPGLINIDFADLKAILEGSGKLAYLNTAEIPRKNGGAKELMNKVLNSPLYPYSIRGAKGVLFNIAGEKKLSLTEVGEISNTISGLASPEAKIIFGISQGSKYSNVIKTTVLATGCGMKNFSAGPEKPAEPKNKPPKKIVRQKREERSNSPVKKKISKKKAVKPGSREEKSEIKKIKIEAATVQDEKVAAGEKEETKNEEIAERKNGLQLKKEMEEMEKGILEKEKLWETPAFLRKNISEN
ncbi:MAG: cell division protein FtsZ [Candidatus Pacebacteria bacterium]|nr:cell division protein FtsZ [Candidatus Paceibacterota bacterium]